MDKFYIVDAANILFRSYYAIGFMTNQEGHSTNALFGFIRSILKLIKDFQPEYLVIVFDAPDNKKSRRELYEDYKSHRKKMPEDLLPQMEWAIEFCKAYGLPLLCVDGVEADDTMGTLAIWAAKSGDESYLCSSDKDLCQMVNEHIKVINLAKDNLLIEADKVKEIYGVKPSQIVDYLALTGDASDNIPGVEGIGPKTAIQLLEEYESLDNLYKNIHEIKGKKGDTLRASEEIARLSQKLATIHDSVPCELEKPLFKLHPPIMEQLQAFYQRMHFLAFLKELGTAPKPILLPDAKAEQLSLFDEEKSISYQMLTSVETLKERLGKATSIVIDTETTGIEPLLSELVGVSFCATQNEAFYIPFTQDVKASLKALIENPAISWIGHNIKFDKHILKTAGIELSHIGFDTMVASYMVNPHNQRHNLDILSLENFNKVKIPIENLIGKGKNQITMREAPIDKVAEYACEDADYTLRLKERFEDELKKKNLENLFHELEIPLIDVLYRMERKGIYIDCDYLKTLSQELGSTISALEEGIYEGAKEKFNLNSPKQLGEILFEKMGIHPPKKTATGSNSTAIEVLEELQESIPFVKKIIEYRTLEKLRSTYVDALSLQVNPHTKRIHCTFNQSVAATGRLSSQDPNLQNIPVRTKEGKKIREAFKPENPNWSFLSADYSQIELRLLAHMSEDPLLMKAFQDNEDVHAFTASQVFGVPLNEVTSDLRSKAKAVNFGILYGQQAFGLSQGLSLSYKEAQEFIDRYFKRYSKVKDFLEHLKQSARIKGYSESLFGRKRPIPEITSKNGMIRAAAERLAINSPFQGSNADIIKKAMIQIDQVLLEKKELGELLLQIHDELLFESPDQNVEHLGTIVKKHMENVIVLKVPLIVDISIGKNWAEC